MEKTGVTHASRHDTIREFGRYDAAVSMEKYTAVNVRINYVSYQVG